MKAIKLFIVVSALLVSVTHATFANILPTEKQRESIDIGILINAFTEIGFLNVQASKMSQLEMVEFAVFHNFNNSQDSQYSVISKREDGKFLILAQTVENTLKKFLDLSIEKHQTVVDVRNRMTFTYDEVDNAYVFDYPVIAEGYAANVNEISSSGDPLISVSGELDMSGATSMTAIFEATVKKQGENYVLESLVTTPTYYEETKPVEP